MMDEQAAEVIRSVERPDLFLWNCIKYVVLMHGNDADKRCAEEFERRHTDLFSVST